MSLKTLLVAWAFVGIWVLLFMTFMEWTTGFIILTIFGCITWVLIIVISMIDVSGLFQFKRKLRSTDFFRKLDSTQRHNEHA
jgi:amino acid transporter